MHLHCTGDKQQQYAWNGSRIVAINQDLLNEGFTAAGGQQEQEQQQHWLCRTHRCVWVSACVTDRSDGESTAAAAASHTHVTPGLSSRVQDSSGRHYLSVESPLL